MFFMLCLLFLHCCVHNGNSSEQQSIWKLPHHKESNCGGRGWADWKIIILVFLIYWLQVPIHLHFRNHYKIFYGSWVYAGDKLNTSQGFQKWNTVLTLSVQEMAVKRIIRFSSILHALGCSIPSVISPVLFQLQKNSILSAWRVRPGIHPEPLVYSTDLA